MHPMLWSVFNEMFVGDIPEKLKNLTLVEQMLIALACTFMRVYRRTASRYAYKNHVINIAQNLETFEATFTGK